LRGGRDQHRRDPVNLRKTTGYVWVLATHNKVMLHLQESREGAFLKDLLAEFSESCRRFFLLPTITSMSAPEMPVHLMRDINDDLRRHPFDDELRTSPMSLESFWKCRIGRLTGGD